MTIYRSSLGGLCWGPGGLWGGGALLAAVPVDEAGEAVADELRVHPLLDAEHSDEDELLELRLLFDAHLDAARERQEHDVRGCDAVDGGDERGGDAAADGGDVGQVAHHVDEAEDGADDADRRAVAARRFVDLGRVFAVLL